jgi:hypothetical protein
MAYRLKAFERHPGARRLNRVGPRASSVKYFEWDSISNQGGTAETPSLYGRGFFIFKKKNIEWRIILWLKDWKA